MPEQDHDRKETAYGVPAAEKIPRRSVGEGAIEATGDPGLNPPPRERLFSRKVMIAWATVTLAVYIAFQIFGGPIKAAIASRIDPPESNTGSPPSDRVIRVRTVPATKGGVEVRVIEKKPAPAIPPKAPERPAQPIR
ncbi:MAG: hypothetical protein H0T48_14445 [Gemmatimonadaceae bacterium]|nr:hypothetical protein [Gemmatimonadaceae bacterium]